MTHKTGPHEERKVQGKGTFRLSADLKKIYPRKKKKKMKMQPTGSRFLTIFGWSAHPFGQLPQRVRRRLSNPLGVAGHTKRASSKLF
jgi:hypothetical protein